MSGGIVNRLEVAVNVALLCAFLAVAALAVKRFWTPQQGISEPTVGTKLSLQNADWGASDKSLVLVLSVGCHYCSESAEFYKRLLPVAQSARMRILAVLPQPLSESRAYLDNLGVSVPDVRQSSLQSVDVSGTPSLLLVDRSGRIEKAWVGKLGPEQEKQVLARLQ